MLTLSQGPGRPRLHCTCQNWLLFLLDPSIVCQHLRPQQTGTSALSAGRTSALVHCHFYILRPVYVLVPTFDRKVTDNWPKFKFAALRSVYSAVSWAKGHRLNAGACQRRHAVCCFAVRALKLPVTSNFKASGEACAEGMHVACGDMIQGGPQTLLLGNRHSKIPKTVCSFLYAPCACISVYDLG